jgi:hypothetical protein
MLTSPDDGLVRSHEEARAVLTYAVPGACVSIYRPRLQDVRQHTTERSRAYTITVRRMGREDAAVIGSYTLPVAAERLARHAREQVAKAAQE